MAEPNDAGCVNCTDDAQPAAPSDLMTTGDLLHENRWISRTGLVELMDAGKVPFYRFGGEGSRRLVSRSEWNAFVNANRIEPEA